jgi:hypothetical protein
MILQNFAFSYNNNNNNNNNNNSGKLNAKLLLTLTSTLKSLVISCKNVIWPWPCSTQGLVDNLHFKAKLARI